MARKARPRSKPKRKLSAYNRHVRAEMKKGKSMKQAARSWKGGRKSTKKRSPVRRATGGKKTVAKGGFNSQKVMKLIRLAALAMPAVTAAMEAGISPQGRVRNAVRLYTGYDISNGTFDAGYLSRGWTPYLAAVLATYGIPKLAGLIRGL